MSRQSSALWGWQAASISGASRCRFVMQWRKRSRIRM